MYEIVLLSLFAVGVIMLIIGMVEQPAANTDYELTDTTPRQRVRLVFFHGNKAFSLPFDCVPDGDGEIRIRLSLEELQWRFWSEPEIFALPPNESFDQSGAPTYNENGFMATYPAVYIGYGEELDCNDPYGYQEPANEFCDSHDWTNACSWNDDTFSCEQCTKRSELPQFSH